MPKEVLEAAEVDGATPWQRFWEVTFPLIQTFVRGVVTVSDAQLVAAMRFFAERMKLIVEPTGCLGAAALFEGAAGLPDLRGKRVGVILSGGNVDLARYAALLAG
jgi:threonine dehydratase